MGYGAGYGGGPYHGGGGGGGPGTCNAHPYIQSEYIRYHYILPPHIGYVNDMWMALTWHSLAWQWRHHWRAIHGNQGAKTKARPQVVTWHREFEKDWTSTANICQTFSKLNNLVGCQLYFQSISCCVKVKELAPLVSGTQTDSFQWRKLFVEKQTCDVTTCT